MRKVVNFMLCFVTIKIWWSLVLISIFPFDVNRTSEMNKNIILTFSRVQGLINIKAAELPFLSDPDCPALGTRGFQDTKHSWKMHIFYSFSQNFTEAPLHINLIKLVWFFIFTLFQKHDFKGRHYICYIWKVEREKASTRERENSHWFTAQMLPNTQKQELKPVSLTDGRDVGS